MAELVDAYLLVLRLKHDLQTWGSSTHRGLVYMSPSAIKKNIHRTGSNPVLTTTFFIQIRLGIPAIGHNGFFY